MGKFDMPDCASKAIHPGMGGALLAGCDLNYEVHPLSSFGDLLTQIGAETVSSKHTPSLRESWSQVLFRTLHLTAHMPRRSKSHRLRHWLCLTRVAR